MIIFDTNVISELQKPNCDERILQWLDSLEHADIRMSAIVYAELLAGSEKFNMQTGSSKYIDMLDAFMLKLINPNLLPFDEYAAKRFGKMRAMSEINGVSKPMIDLMIAATAAANNAILATRNVKDFEGLDVRLINPFER